MDAETEQNRSQRSVQSCRIQQLPFYYLRRTMPGIRPEMRSTTIISKVSTIDLIFRDQAYHQMCYSIQRLIKSAFHRIHQSVVKCAFSYSLTHAHSCLYYSHTIHLVLQLQSVTLSIPSLHPFPLPWNPIRYFPLRLCQFE